MLEIGGRSFVPWMLGNRLVGEAAVERCRRRVPVRFLDIFAPQTLPFYRLVNAGNQVAFGSLGMPAWVQLDCCTLPSAMVGLALPREQVASDLFERLQEYVGRTFGPTAAVELDAYHDLVPISEYCGAPTPEPGVTIGFSMFTLLPGLKLGLRSKALALLAYGTQLQIGTTQYDNVALCSHTRLGPLEIVEPLARMHSKPDRTFLYQVRTADPEHLLALYTDGDAPVAAPPIDLEVPVTSGPEAATAVIALIAQHGRLAIVPPGLRAGEPPTLCLAKVG